MNGARVEWYPEQQFWLKSRGRHLAAVLHLPMGPLHQCEGCGRWLHLEDSFCIGCGVRVDPHPALPIVLILHGFSGNKSGTRQLFVRIARKLASQGIGALRFDYGRSGDSEGNFEYTTVQGWVSDALAAYTYITSLKWVDQTRVGVLGHSLGGAVAALILPQTRFRCVVQWAPVSDLIGFAERNFHVDPKRMSGVKASVEDEDGNRVKREFFKDLPRLHPLGKVSYFKGSVLILHGANDTFVPPSDGQAYMNSYGRNDPSTSREFYLIECPGHEFASTSGTNELLDRTSYWIKKHL